VRAACSFLSPAFLAGAFPKGWCVYGREIKSISPVLPASGALRTADVHSFIGEALAKGLRKQLALKAHSV
jgi:hypothetical protein